jgi:Protein of unknown function (DUF3038)
VKIFSLESQDQDLPIVSRPDAQQLDNLKIHLNLILVALEALAKIDSESILQAAQALNLDKIIVDRVEFWQLDQDNLLDKSSSGLPRLNIRDIEEAKSGFNSPRCKFTRTSHRTRTRTSQNRTIG